MALRGAEARKQQLGRKQRASGAAGWRRPCSKGGGHLEGYWRRRETEREELKESVTPPSFQPQ